MASKAEVERAVLEAKRVLAEHGHECSTTADELILWFSADTPFEDTTLDGVLGRPLIVIHELVEIHHVKRRGLGLTQDVIVKNLEQVDEAHYEAAEVELDIALRLGEMSHVAGRLKDVEQWSIDPTVVPAMKAKYRGMMVRYAKALEKLGDKEPKRRRGAVCGPFGRTPTK
jgi:hypothetical protein